MPARNHAALDFLAARRSRPAKLFTRPVPSRDRADRDPDRRRRACPTMASWSRGG